MGKVSMKNAKSCARKPLLKVLNGIRVKFDDPNFRKLLQQILGKHSHSGSNLNHRALQIDIQNRDDLACNVLVGQKMLAQMPVGCMQ